MSHGTACLGYARQAAVFRREFEAGLLWEFLIGAMRGVGFFRQFVQAVEKVLALTDE